jgi:hypothetical protein
MSSNRFHYYIKNIVENSKLNKEKFVKNKKLNNNSLVKNKNKNNHNLILKRNFGSFSFRFEDPNNNNNNNNSGFIVIAGLVSYFITRKFDKK